MKFFAKALLIPFIYLIITAITGIGFANVEEIPRAVAFVIIFLDCILFLFIQGTFAFKHGEKGYKTLINNDIERREIVRTGEFREINKADEYAPWKGFVLGLLVCAPLIICMTIHTICYFSGSEYVGMGYLTGLIYNCFFGMIQLTVENITSATYFLNLIMLPLVVLANGIPYVLGAKKTRTVYEKILAREKYLNGDKH